MWIGNWPIEYEGQEDEFHLYPIGDLQMGPASAGVRLEFIRWWINDKIIRDPKAIVCFMGDLEDDDRPTTRIARAQSFADRPEVPEADASKHLLWIDKKLMPILEPLAKHTRGIIGGVAGHHFTKISHRLISTQYILRRLGQMQAKRPIYLGEMSGWMWLRFRPKNWAEKGEKSIKKLLHIQHGEGGGQAIGSPLTKLDKTAQSFEADLYLRGHDCRKCVAKITKLYPTDSEDKPIIRDREIALMNVGSATEGFVQSRNDIAYPERAMLRPAARGWGIARFYIRRMHAWEHPARPMTADITCEV